ncbi:alcohol dehydrogenase YqhD (iron-dependent ADH family) [Weissella uvarum]|uniref:iron-containing alcohol dehydrogenase n=1 Tax=Weissella uvarum TaxID=1479233 RepID=UPI00195F5260|nr:iron-containing alcohol dehydrogenase [Weissella uvarum]MBM7616810.1 alcohol dehydrogenase YqhD (iron-dependent ADH family) [Weissella uvarum]MCM0594738.1 iron-containing alcohol dehydrogenase [Weissella uvarum]
MQDFTFVNKTEVHFGQNRIDHELADVMARYGKRVLLTYGGGSIKKSGLYDRVMKQLADFDVIELDGIAPNPKIDSVRAGQKLAVDNDVDVILAVGGGSVIDASKMIASAKFYAGDPWDLVLKPSLRMDIDQLPIVDIVTLSATGTEMNYGSVISNPETNQKLGSKGPNSPAVSFLDPTLAYSVSKWQTAAGSIDIMSHLFEQYFDNAANKDVQDGVKEGIMRAVIKWAPIALAEPDNYDARANLMWGATMALNGITGVGNENVWTVHPIEHELSAYYDITHGVGLGILTPRWMNYVLSAETAPKFAQYGRNVWHLTGDDDMEVAKTAIQKTYDWIKDLGVPTTLPGVGIENDEHFDAMAQAAVDVNKLDQKAYVKLQPADVVKIYEASMTTDGFE